MEGWSRLDTSTMYPRWVLNPHGEYTRQCNHVTNASGATQVGSNEGGSRGTGGAWRCGHPRCKGSFVFCGRLLFRRHRAGHPGRPLVRSHALVFSGDAPSSPQRPLLISQMRPGNPEACSTGTGDFRLRAAGRRTIRRATPCWLWRRTGRASTWCRRAWPMWHPFPARLSSMISARAAS